MIWEKKHLLPVIQLHWTKAIAFPTKPIGVYQTLISNKPNRLSAVVRQRNKRTNGSIQFTHSACGTANWFSYINRNKYMEIKRKSSKVDRGNRTSKCQIYKESESKSGFRIMGVFGMEMRLKGSMRRLKGLTVRKEHD